MLEALSPALKSELDRVMQEAQLRFEQEFEQKLRDATLEAELKAKQGVDQAVAETREAVRKQVTVELETQYNRTLQEATDRLREHWETDRAQLREELEEWRIYADAPRQLGEADSQADMLQRFLSLAERFAPSLAVYISRSDGLCLWKTRGSAIFPQKMPQSPGSSDLFLREVVVRGKLVAAVCAARPFKLDALDYLIAALQTAIELFGVRLRNPVPRPATRSVAAAAGADGVRPPQKDNVQ
jgi:hypothetical protein